MDDVPTAVRLVVDDGSPTAMDGAALGPWGWPLVAVIIAAVVVTAWAGTRRLRLARRDPAEVAFRRLCRGLRVGRAEAERIRAASRERPGVEPVGLLLTGLADG